MDLFAPDILSSAVLDVQGACSCRSMHIDFLLASKRTSTALRTYRKSPEDAVACDGTMMSEAEFPELSRVHWYATSALPNQAMHRKVSERRSRPSSLQHHMPARDLRSKGSASVRGRAFVHGAARAWPDAFLRDERTGAEEAGGVAASWSGSLLYCNRPRSSWGGAGLQFSASLLVASHIGGLRAPLAGGSGAL